MVTHFNLPSISARISSIFSAYKQEHYKRKGIKENSPWRLVIGNQLNERMKKALKAGWLTKKTINADGG
jgi:hypothetical protein